MKIFRLDRDAIMDAFVSGRVTFIVYGLGEMVSPLATVSTERDTRVFSGK
jgi:hypothetical protein